MSKAQDKKVGKNALTLGRNDGNILLTGARVSATVRTEIHRHEVRKINGFTTLVSTMVNMKVEKSC